MWDLINMERFFYIGDVAANNISYAWPIESWRGAHPASDTTLNLYFTPLQEIGLAPDKDNDVITLTLSDNNKHKDVLEAMALEMNSSEKPVITIIDVDASVTVSRFISSFTITMSSDV